MITTKKLYYYFAYGSNMLRERLEVRVGNVKLVGTTVLNDYTLLFNMRGGFANIQKCLGEKVEGVVYGLTAEQFALLDVYEGYYIRCVIRNNKEAYNTYFGLTYMQDNNRMPDLFYLNTLIDGAMDHKLKYTYNKLVEYKNSNYNLKKSRHRLWV